MLTVERLQELLHYEPMTGVFTRLIRTSSNAPIGSVAGCVRKSDGYCVISIDNRKYRAHRLAVLYVTGSWPTHETDHKNVNTSDNRWCNLRPATVNQNGANRRMRRTNPSGFKGVSWHKKSGSWQARVTSNGKCSHLGLFDTPEAAHARYSEVALATFGEFARCGS